MSERRKLSSSSASWCSRPFFFVAPAVVTRLRRRSAIVENWRADGRGVVREKPSRLLASANKNLRAAGRPQASLDEIALAAALRSEHGREPKEVRRWVAWAIRNSADRRGLSIFRRLTRSRNPRTSGLFARQRVDGRYAATNQGPQLRDLELAQEVLQAPKSADPTNGATNFFSPRAQDALFRRARAEERAIARGELARSEARFAGRINRDGDAVRKKWIRDGLRPRGAPSGVNPRVVQFFAA